MSYIKIFLQKYNKNLNNLMFFKNYLLTSHSNI